MMTTNTISTRTMRIERHPHRASSDAIDTHERGPKGPLFVSDTSLALCLFDVLAHRADCRSIVFRTEDCRTCDEGVGTRGRNLRDVVDLHTPIDFKPDLSTARV